MFVVVSKQKQSIKDCIQTYTGRFSSHQNPLGLGVSILYEIFCKIFPTCYFIAVDFFLKYIASICKDSRNVNIILYFMSPFTNGTERKLKQKPNICVWIKLVCSLFNVLPWMPVLRYVAIGIRTKVSVKRRLHVYVSYACVCMRTSWRRSSVLISFHMSTATHPNAGI